METRARIVGLLLAGALLLAGGGHAAGLPAGIHELRDWSQPPGKDLRPIRKFVGARAVVGLGEAFHGTEGFERTKLRLIKDLVRRKGFRAVALETPWRNAEVAAEYVSSCAVSPAGTPEEALDSLNLVWQGAGMRDLLAWMCSWNRKKPKDPVFFYGFDVQAQGEADRDALREFLSRVGVPQSDPRWRQLDDCYASVFFIVSDDPLAEGPHLSCSEALAGIDRFFEDEEAAILDVVNPAELAAARIALAGLEAWEGMVFYKGRSFALSYESRDRGMAYVLAALRELRFPGAKTLVWAHNGHIATGRYVPGADVMGTFLDAAFGDAYTAIALIAYDADFDFAGLGCGSLGPAVKGSVEARLRALGPRNLFVDLAFPGAGKPFLEPRRKYPFGWNRPLYVRRQFDALVYIEHATPLVPVLRDPCDLF